MVTAPVTIRLVLPIARFSQQKFHHEQQMASAISRIAPPSYRNESGDQ
jgi:hypothetical protein